MNAVRDMTILTQPKIELPLALKPRLCFQQVTRSRLRPMSAIEQVESRSVVLPTTIFWKVKKNMLIELKTPQDSLP